MEDLNHNKNNKYLCKNHVKKGILFRLMNSITKSFSRINLLRYSRNSLSFSTIFFSVFVLFFSCSLHSTPTPLFFLYLLYFQLKDMLSLYSWRYSCLNELFLPRFLDEMRLLGLFALFRLVIQ